MLQHTAPIVASMDILLRLNTLTCPLSFLALPPTRMGPVTLLLARYLQVSLNGHQTTTLRLGLVRATCTASWELELQWGLDLQMATLHMPTPDTQLL